MALIVPQAEELRIRLVGPFEEQGPFLGRNLSPQSDKLRVSNTTGLGSAPGALGGLGGLGAAIAPKPSYQSLFFDTLDGGVPVSPVQFDFEMEPIPFIGAITEVDVIASDPGNDWLMTLELEGQGPIFRTVQPLLILTAAGWFRPTPPGFWPETEGLVFPVPAAGLHPILRVRREGIAPNLTLRVLIVAHPA